MKPFLVYMKNYILVILLLVSGVVCAQSNVITNRLTIRDSLSLDGQWISQINRDSTLQLAGPNSVSTDGAIRKFIQQTINKPAAGKGTRSDSVLTIDPATRQIAMSKLSAGGSMPTTALVAKTLFKRHALKVNFSNNLSDSLSCLVTSSDGQTTNFVMQANTGDFIYAAGIPPFTLQADIPNTYAGSRLTAGITPYTNYIESAKMFNRLRWSASYGETMHMKVPSLVWDVNFQVGVRDTTEDNGYSNIGVTYKNNSSKLAIIIQDGDQVVPGLQHSFGDFVYLPTGATKSIDIYINELVNMATAVQYTRVPTTSCRISIYKNGSLFSQNVYTPDVSSNMYNLVIDNSWNSYEIVLDDI